MANRYFAFEYISLDERLLRQPAIVQINLNSVTIKGVLTTTVYDPIKKGFFNMSGFFIEYQGNEYGSVSVDPAFFIQSKLDCCNNIRLFDYEFDMEFE